MTEGKIVDRIFLTRKQVSRLDKGKVVHFSRYKHKFVLGLKPKHTAAGKLKERIKKMQLELKKLKGEA